MLKRIVISALSSLLAWGICSVGCTQAAAEQPTRTTHLVSYVDTVTLEATDTETSGAAADKARIEGSGTAQRCYTSTGTEVPCWQGEFWWSVTYDKYCIVAHNIPPDSPWWNGHRDTQGNPIGVLYDCHVYNSTELVDNPLIWEPTPPTTPHKAGSDPETTVRTAIASLKLHPPTVGVGAYVYPKYEKWGLGWWVGAPMWLWVDKNDPLQWGSHTITASAGTASITATITATQVTYTTGDDTPPTVCKTPGTPRPWKKDDPLDRHSPTNCEHTYWHTNKLGDVNSRYTVTATVTWNITWSTTDGQYGTFTMDLASTDNPTIHVGELYVVRVPDPTPTGPR